MGNSSTSDDNKINAAVVQNECERIRERGQYLQQRTLSFQSEHRLLQQLRYTTFLQSKVDAFVAISRVDMKTIDTILVQVISMTNVMQILQVNRLLTEQRIQRMRRDTYRVVLILFIKHIWYQRTNIYFESWLTNTNDSKFINLKKGFQSATGASYYIAGDDRAERCCQNLKALHNYLSPKDFPLLQRGYTAALFCVSFLIGIAFLISDAGMDSCKYLVYVHQSNKTITTSPRSERLSLIDAVMQVCDWCYAFESDFKSIKAALDICINQLLVNTGGGNPALGVVDIFKYIKYCVTSSLQDCYSNDVAVANIEYSYKHAYVVSDVSLSPLDAMKSTLEIYDTAKNIIASSAAYTEVAITIDDKIRSLSFTHIANAQRKADVDEYVINVNNVELEQFLDFNQVETIVCIK